MYVRNQEKFREGVSTVGEWFGFTGRNNRTEGVDLKGEVSECNVTSLREGGVMVKCWPRTRTLS